MDRDSLVTLLNDMIEHGGLLIWDRESNEFKSIKGVKETETGHIVISLRSLKEMKSL
jgi:hypothetical protein